MWLNEDELAFSIVLALTVRAQKDVRLAVSEGMLSACRRAAAADLTRADLDLHTAEAWCWTAQPRPRTLVECFQTSG